MVVNLRAKKRLVSRVTGAGVHRIYFDPEHLEDISDAITRSDMRSLVTAGKIVIKPIVGTSRGRARRKRLQRSKRGTKAGSKHGRSGARIGKKQVYVKKVRALRHLLKVAKDRAEITNPEFWELYKKVGGNTVRNKAHLRLLIAEAKEGRPGGAAAAAAAAAAEPDAGASASADAPAQAPPPPQGEEEGGADGGPADADADADADEGISDKA